MRRTCFGQAWNVLSHRNGCVKNVVTVLERSCIREYRTFTTGYPQNNKTGNVSHVRNMKRRPVITQHKPTKGVYVKDTDIQAEYGLKEEDLEGIPFKTLRDAYEQEQHMFPGGRYARRVYPRELVVKRALQKYKTRLNMKLQSKKYVHTEEEEDDIADALGRLLKILTKEDKALKNQKSKNSWYANEDHKRVQIISSLKVVSFSIGTNFAVAILKFGSYFYTGSASMLSESIHSVIDTMNQLFLAFGLIYSLKKPHSDHPYGFDKARYVYALISGVSIFEIGCVYTITHGVSQLYNPSLVLDHSLSTAYAVLLFTAVIEGWSLSFAYRQAKIQSQLEGVSFYHYIFKGYEPNTIAVLAEDIAATLGVVIAGTSIGNPMYDALGSIGIGTLLGGMAIFIIVRNKDALIGRSMNSMKQTTIVNMLEREETVLSVNDVKSMVEGPSYVRFKAEIFFNTEIITKKYLDTLDTTSLLREAQSLKTETDMENFMMEQNQRMVDTLAIEVDRLEYLIKRKYPEIRHVDLELL
ncbi:proton-coupled zinc antiporter SLC30A9, mitochondrial-like isoform X2 [Bolinopsis microptera]|uniref:proton-coupled zinc antiporter SLC30A9, mitochondrial-like isoform X2 n=1 Tax=Bolinopsis microptera TaxID=2820187 RepID=UPI00307AD540